MKTAEEKAKAFLKSKGIGHRKIYLREPHFPAVDFVKLLIEYAKQEKEGNLREAAEYALGVGGVINRRELLLDFANYSESDKTSQTTDECVDNYLDSLKQQFTTDSNMKRAEFSTNFKLKHKLKSKKALSNRLESKLRN